MSDLSIPTWLEPRIIEENDHEELKRLANGKYPFYFRDINRELIVKFYNKYPRELFYRLLRVLGFYGARFTGKIAAYSGPQDNYPKVISVDRRHWERKIVLPEVLPILAPSFRSFGLSNLKQLHGVPMQCIIALSGNNLFPEKIPIYFYATIIEVNDDFFNPIINSSRETFNSIVNKKTLYTKQQDAFLRWQYTAEDDVKKYYSDQRLSKSIVTLQLSSESLNDLRANGIKYIGELVAKNDEQLTAIFHGRKKPLQEIKVQLWMLGLCTGLKVNIINSDSVPPCENDSFSIDSMNLSVRSAKCLKQANIKTISDLMSKNDNDLLSIPHFGNKCLNEIKSGLEKLKLSKEMIYVPQFSIPENDQLFNQDEILSALKIKVNDLLLSERTRGCLRKKNIEFIWQLAQLSKNELRDTRNLGLKTIKEIVKILNDFGFWLGMRFTSNQLAAINSFEPALEPVVLSISIKHLIEKLSCHPLPFLNDRENLIVKERLFKIGKKKTLEELAMQFSLSRERMRQLEKSASRKIRQHHLKDLQIIVGELKQRVEHLAGLADLDELGIDRKEFSAREQIIANSLFQVMDEKVFIDWRFGLVSTRGEKWIDSICDAIELRINETVSEKFFTENILTETVEGVCVGFGLSSSQCHINLTKRFLLEKKVTMLNNLLCCGRVTKQDQIILAFKELFPDGLEVYKKHNLLIEKLKISDPERFSGASPRAILGRLTNHPDVFLWRRGFFIHKDHISYSEAVVENVTAWIEQRFDQGHSRFQVDVPFNIFRDRLLQGGVPNQYALYTLLRLQNNLRIGQRKFPTIVDLQADVDIQEGILEELERYFYQAGGPVPYPLLKDEFLVKRGWKVYSMQQNITTHSEVIYPWHDGSYIHLDHMTVNYAKLEELLDAIRTKLNTIQGAYSLKGARREMSVLWEQACPSASVRTMIKLIRSVDPEDLQIERYFIQYADQLADFVSATLELEEFCLDKDVEVSSHELHEEFCKQRGWSENQYYTALRKANLLRSGRSTYLHPATISWNESLSLGVHQVMEFYLNERNKNHYPHMQIEELIYQYALPDLPQNIPWTRHLLKSIGSEFGDFLFFDDAYIFIDNDFDIEDLDDMIGFLIGRHFRIGIAKRAEVEQLLWREGILESGKSIPSDHYFDESSIIFFPESDEIGLSSNGIERYGQSI